MQQEQFYLLSDYLQSLLQPTEDYLCNYLAEQSDFIRFNKGKVRQPGNVQQQSMTIQLVNGKTTQCICLQ